MLSMALLPDPLVLLVAEPSLVIAYLVFGMVGFGTTLVAAPLLAQVLAVSTVVPALALTDFIASCTNGLRLGANVVRVEVMRLLPAMLCGSALGAWVLFAVPVKALMLMLGVFVVLYALNGLRSQPLKPRLGPRWSWWYGGAGGVLSALFGAGGWVYSMYLLRRLDDPQQVRATQVLFTIAGRYFDVQLLVLVACLLPAVAMGLYAGHRITLGMDRRRFMQVLYGVLLVTGTSLVMRALA
jgi:uncharacterized membrane protein YfcA